MTEINGVLVRETDGALFKTALLSKTYITEASVLKTTVEIFGNIVKKLKVASVNQETRQVMVVGYVSGDDFAKLAEIAPDAEPETEEE